MTKNDPDSLDFDLRRSVQLAHESPEALQQAARARARALAPECPSCHKPVRHRKGLEWCQDHQMSEKTLQNRVVERAKRRGWDVKHVGKGIAAFDAEGAPIFVSTAKSFPDLFMLNPKMPPGRRVLAIELKREEGEFEPGQLEYLQLLNLCGIPAVPVRPSDLRLGRVNAILEGR